MRCPLCPFDRPTIEEILLHLPFAHRAESIDLLRGILSAMIEEGLPGVPVGPPPGGS